MKRLNVKRAAGCLALLLAVGCSRNEDFTALSSKNVALTIDPGLRRGTYEGTDLKWRILFIPLGFPHVKEAADRALIAGEGNLLLNAVVYSEIWGLVPIVWVEGFTVRGDVYQIDQPIGPAGKESR